MVTIVSVFVFVALVIVFFPYEVFRRRHTYSTKRIKRTSVQKNQRVQSMESVFRLSGKIAEITRISLSDDTREKNRRKVVYAGLGDRITPEEIVGSRVLAVFLVGLLFLPLLLGDMSIFNGILLVTVLIMAYYVPDHWITMKGKNRQLKIEREIPSILSAMAIVTDAGYNLVQAMEVVVDQNEGQLCDELNKVIEDIKIGISMKEAFVSLSRRTNVEELNYFVAAVIQGMEKGAAGITKIIKEQAQESWDKRRHKAKELAEKASMKLFLPLLLLVFPAFMIYLLGPMIFSVIRILGGGSM